MPEFKLMIARFPGGGVECMECVDWLLRLSQEVNKDKRIKEVYDWRLADTPITMVRNRCVLTAQEAQVDYLLMIDNDMEPDPRGAPAAPLLLPGAKPFWETTWEFMMSHLDEPCAVCAPYCGPSPWNNIYVFRWRNKNNRPTLAESLPSLDQFTREEAAILGGIQEVAAGPTGLILYDMRVFKDMSGPHFYYEYKDDGMCCSHCGQRKQGFQYDKASTEDVTQTRNMSMAWYATGGKQGGKLYCNWDAWANHVKRERVFKPMPYPADSIALQFKDAVLKGYQSGDRLHVEPASKFDFAALQRSIEERSNGVPIREPGTPDADAGRDHAARAGQVLPEDF